MLPLKIFADAAQLRLVALFFHYPRGQAGELMSVMLALVALAALGWMSAVVWKRYRGDRALNSPHKLFQSLCRAHHLDRNQRRLLTALAQQHRLPQPAALFLRPDLFRNDKVAPQFAAQSAQILLIGNLLFKQS